VAGFDWAVEFAEVFAEGGFDIVVANPPYVRMELFKENKPLLRQNFTRVHAERADPYCYFYGRAIEMLRPGGMIAFISSNKWLRAGNGVHLREYMASESQVISITDFGELPVFQSAATFPMIFIAQKSNRSGETIFFTQVNTLEPPYPDILRLIKNEGTRLPSSSLNGSDWRITNNTQLLDRMISRGVSLEKYVKGDIYAGIKTGLNSAFWLTQNEYESIVRKQPKSAEIITPLLVGDNIRRWRIDSSYRWIIYTPQGIDIRPYSAILDHLRPWKGRLETRALNQKWYELQQAQYKYSLTFNHPKIVYPDIAMESRFFLDLQGH